MKIQETSLEGVYILEPVIYTDQRGYFLETYRDDKLRQAGITSVFVQDNYSFSCKGTVRGLHYQVGSAVQEKLVIVCRGRILDVVVDLRRRSPTFGRHLAIELDDREHRMVFVPAGFAHGFSVLSDEAAISYKCSSYYDKDSERGVRWNDPFLKIDWQVENPVVSNKDQNQPLMEELEQQDLF